MRTKNKAPANKYFLVLTIFVIAVVMAHLIWIKLDKRPPIGNGLTDLFPAVLFYLDVINFGPHFHELLKILNSPYVLVAFFGHICSYIKVCFFVYPPLAPLSYSLTYFLFGINSGVETMVNSLYLAATLFAIYGIGRKIFNEKVGLLAAFIFSSFPGIIGLSRQIYAEFILMCMVTVTACLLLKTDYFKDRKYSILLGVSLGLTALVKWEFPLAIGVPFLVFLSRAFIFPGPSGRKGVFKNFFLVVLIAAAIASFWYSMSFKDIIYRLLSANAGIPAGDIKYYSTLYSLKKFTFYPLAVTNIFLSLPYLLLFIISVSVLLYKFIRLKKSFSLKNDSVFYVLFFSSWIIFAYLLYSSFKLLIPSRIMSVIPAFAVIISAGILAVKNKIIRRFLLYLTLLYGLLTYAYSFINFKFVDLLYNTKICLSNDGKLSFADHHASATYGNRDTWIVGSRFSMLRDGSTKAMIKEIFDFIKEDSRMLGHRPIIFILSGDQDFNCFSFQYYNLIDGFKFFIEPRGNDRSLRPPPYPVFDYVVIQLLSSSVDFNRSTLKEIISFTPNIEAGYHGIDGFYEGFFNNYTLIKQYLSSKVLVYKINRPIPGEQIITAQ